MKKLLLAILLAFTSTAPIGLAEPVDTAKNDTTKKSGHPPEFFAARRAELRARKEARLERVRQYKADRQAAQEKLYQDWHDRYVADAPVREAYYRNQESAYQAQAAARYAMPQTIIFVNQDAATTNSPFGFGPTFTPSCSTSRAAFFGGNYTTPRMMFPNTVQLPTIQP
jgi:hypothetical protein